MLPIREAYNYFRSIGLNGQSKDKWITKDLSLVSKPNLFYRIFGCTQNRDKTTIAAAITTLDKILVESQYDENTCKMAIFIKGVLNNLQLNRDPHLQNLEHLNTLFERLDLSQEKEHVEKQYLETGNINQTSSAVRRIKAGNAGRFQYLPLEMIAKIFSFLPLKDRAHAAATCWQWHRAADREDSFDFRALAPNERLYVSTLCNKSIRGIKENRALIKAYKTHEFVTSTVYKAVDRYFTLQYLPKQGDPILICTPESIYIIDSKRFIQHNFGHYYRAIYENSISKIFALAKRDNTFYDLYEIDPESGESVTLCEIPLSDNWPFLNHFAYADNKIWIISELNAFYLYNRENKELSKRDRDRLFPDVSAGLEIAGRPWGDEYTIQNLTRPQEPRKIPNSTEWIKIKAITAEALFVQSDTQVYAINPTTGEKIEGFSHPSRLLSLVRNDYFDIEVNNGILYLERVTIIGSQIDAFDILTGAHLKTISFGWGEETYISLYRKSFWVFDNKIFYISDTELRMREPSLSDESPALITEDV